MASADNRSASNLILLCRLHHAEIDGDNSDRYPEEVLQQWKAKQEASVSEDGGGFTLANDEVQQVIEQSFTDMSTHINATTLHLGGAGGAAIGASGGGGGAIGANATGGPSGPGGPVTVIEGAVGLIELDGLPAECFGAGGGGGGAVDPIATEFSDGELQSGVAGVGGVYGIDGTAGGDTSFGPFVVEGGTAGLSVDQVRLESTNLRLSSLLLAEYFKIADGLVYLGGAGIEFYSFLNLPTQHALVVGLIFEAGNVPIGSYSVRIQVNDPAGQVSGRSAFPVTVSTAGPLLRVPMCAVISVDVNSYGLWTVVVESDSGELGRHDVLVKRATG